MLICIVMHFHLVICVVVFHFPLNISLECRDHRVPVQLCAYCEYSVILKLLISELDFIKYIYALSYILQEEDWRLSICIDIITLAATRDHERKPRNCDNSLWRRTTFNWPLIPMIYFWSMEISLFRDFYKLSWNEGRQLCSVVKPIYQMNSTKAE